MQETVATSPWKEEENGGSKSRIIIQVGDSNLYMVYKETVKFGDEPTRTEPRINDYFGYGGDGLRRAWERFDELSRELLGMDCPFEKLKGLTRGVIDRLLPDDSTLRTERVEGDEEILDALILIEELTGYSFYDPSDEEDEDDDTCCDCGECVADCTCDEEDEDDE